MDDPHFVIDVAGGRVTLKALVKVMGHVFEIRGSVGEGGFELDVVSGGLSLHPAMRRAK